MLKIFKKVQFSSDQNRMQKIADVENAVKEFKVKNLVVTDLKAYKKISKIFTSKRWYR